LSSYFSQYEPNNLNHAIGRSSLFVYDFNLSSMNRKGRMTKAQVENRLALEKEHGKFDPKAIEKDSKKVFSRLLGKCQFLTLYTDEHHAYQRAAEGLSFFHVMTSSKLARNFYNPLFAVNHMDLLCRHHLAAFKRETIAFAKNTVAMAESYILRAVEKNYMLSQFTKKQKRNLVANTHSPAMILKIRDKIQTFGEFFRFRYSVHQVKLSGDWLRLFRSSDPSSRRPIRGYVGI
jgi:IS1 family transposase